MEESLSEWVEPLIQKHTLGYKSHGEFLADSVRRRVENLVESGIHPWSRHRLEIGKNAAPKIDAAHHVAQLMILLVAFVAVGGYAYAQQPWLDDAFSPLATWHISRVYDRYGLFIDFTLYLALFTSAAYVTLGRMFNHRGLAVSLGAVLAVALALTGPTWGFSIRSLGPYAALAFLGLLGGATYGAARSVLPDRLSAIAASGTLILLGVLAYVPQRYSANWLWLGTFMPVLLAMLVFRLAGHARIANEAPALPASLPSDMRDYLPRVGEEKRIVKTYLQRISQQSVKDAAQIANELAYIAHLLDSFTRPEIRAVIARKLDDVLPKQHQLRVELDGLKTNLAGLVAFEKRVVGNLSARYAALPHEAREELNRVLQDELAQQGLMGRLQELEADVAAHEAALESDLAQAANAIRAGAVSRARQLLERTIKRERQADKLLGDMDKLAQKLLDTADRALAGFETSEAAA